MNQLSPSVPEHPSEMSTDVQLNQELSEHVRAIRALGILWENKLIDDGEYKRRAAIFGAE